MSIKLIADSGSSKTDWCLLDGKKKIHVSTQGISPYFLTKDQMVEIFQNELLPKLKKNMPEFIYYYGTGCSNPENILLVKSALKSVFNKSKIFVDTDLIGASKALCGNEKGIACILGTGSNSCYYNGKKVGHMHTAWPKAVERAGLDDAVTPHALRRSRATWLMQAGVSIWEAAGHLGMTTKILEQVYAVHSPDYQERAANLEKPKK